MNKEELKCYHKIWSIINKTDLLNFDERDELHLFLMKFKDEYKELHNKIDKAIEYIKNKQVIDLDYLEEILKDSVVDE